MMLCLHDLIMIRCTWPSQISTGPVGYMCSANGTFSPSTEFIAVIFKSFSKSRECTASKHLRRCGCTASAFLVCDTIWRSSSFDRKKNLENASLFISRYSARPFWTPSRTLLDSLNSSSSSFLLHAAITPGSSSAITSVFLHCRSTAPKRLPSNGNCSMMSSEPKIGSKYCHERCTSSHSSSTSDIIRSVASHVSISSANGALNGLNDIACVITIWSSSICACSSSIRMTYVPVSLYSFTSSTIPSHSRCIFSSAVSMPYSFPATSHTATIASSFALTPISIAAPKVNSGSAAGIDTPASASIFSQCRSRMPGDRIASASGTYTRKASISARIASQFLAQSGSWRWLKDLPILNITLNAAVTSRSIASASRSVKLPSRHRSIPSLQPCAYVQNW